MKKRGKKYLIKVLTFFIVLALNGAPIVTNAQTRDSYTYYQGTGSSVTVKHSHSTYGGSCYAPIYHTHTNACIGYTGGQSGIYTATGANRSGYNVEKNEQYYVVTMRCNACGNTKNVSETCYNGWGANGSIEFWDQTSTAIAQANAKRYTHQCIAQTAYYACGKTTSTVTGYTLNCGKDVNTPLITIQTSAVDSDYYDNIITLNAKVTTGGYGGYISYSGSGNNRYLWYGPDGKLVGTGLTVNVSAPGTYVFKINGSASVLTNAAMQAPVTVSAAGTVNTYHVYTGDTPIEKVYLGNNVIEFEN